MQKQINIRVQKERDSLIYTALEFQNFKIILTAMSNELEMRLVSLRLRAERWRRDWLSLDWR